MFWQKLQEAHISIFQLYMFVGILHGGQYIQHPYGTSAKTKKVHLTILRCRQQKSCVVDECYCQKILW